MIRTKTGAATLSVASNSVLIALKLAAGAITGSIAIITEALHSAIDLMASVVALVSVRKADEPADAEHPYGHEKVENLAAAIEGMLILVGAGVIIYEATRRLVTGAEVEDLGVGIAVIALLGARQRLRRRSSCAGAPASWARPRWRATPRTSAPTRSPRSGCSSASRWWRSPARPRSTRSPRSCVAVAIVVAGIRILTRSGRVLVDEAPPPEELDRIEAVIARARARRRWRATTSFAPAAPAPTSTSTSTSSSARARRSSGRTRWPTPPRRDRGARSRAPRC